MPGSFQLYSVDNLPVGFLYPDRLVQFAATGQHPDIYPWWFVDAGTKAGALFEATARQAGRNLVPFAKVDDGRNDIACFDGGETSGNPLVLMLILDDSGRSYSYAHFDDWLAAAQADAERWRS